MDGMWRSKTFLLPFVIKKLIMLCFALLLACVHVCVCVCVRERERDSTQAHVWDTFHWQRSHLSKYIKLVNFRSQLSKYINVSNATIYLIVARILFLFLLLPCCWFKWKKVVLNIPLHMGCVVRKTVLVFPF